MNLAASPWLLVRRRDGEIESVAPWGISAENGSRYVALAFPRPEYNGAAIQFLIGLLQTAVVLELGALAEISAPADIEDFLESPPSPEQLRITLEALAPAFELTGTGARFLQDLEPLELTARTVPVEQLLLEAPGDNANRQRKDRFVQEGLVGQMCQRCAAVGLLSYQLNASSGGAGHRVGLRGGGPLTTVLKDRESLWRTVWLNVMPREIWNEKRESKLTSSQPVDASIFPWMDQTRTSEKGQPEITAQNIHPLHVFWAMPRRIRLVTSGEAAVCGVCGELSESPVVSFAAKNYGCNYNDEFLHPLTPHFLAKDGTWVPQKTAGARVYWNDLLGYLFEDTEEKSGDDATGRIPADAVRQGINNLFLTPDTRCLWTFGFEMDKAKVRSFTDGTLPLIVADDMVDRSRLEKEVRKLVLGARRAERYLLMSIKKVLKRRPKDVSSALDDVKLQFWTTTEPSFNQTWRAVRDEIGDSQTVLELRQRWRALLIRRCLEIYEDRASLLTATRVNPRRIIQAEIDLEKQLWGQKLREVLDLPNPVKKLKEAA